MYIDNETLYMYICIYIDMRIDVQMDRCINIFVRRRRRRYSGGGGGQSSHMHNRSGLPEIEKDSG